jgi:hypothetical protein
MTDDDPMATGAVAVFEAAMNQWLEDNEAELCAASEWVLMPWATFLTIARECMAPEAKALRAAILQAERDGLLARPLRRPAKALR